MFSNSYPAYSAIYAAFRRPLARNFISLRDLLFTYAGSWRATSDLNWLRTRREYRCDIRLSSAFSYNSVAPAVTGRFNARSPYNIIISCKVPIKFVTYSLIASSPVRSMRVFADTRLLTYSRHYKLDTPEPRNVR